MLVITLSGQIRDSIYSISPWELTVQQVREIEKFIIQKQKCYEQHKNKGRNIQRCLGQFHWFESIERALTGQGRRVSIPSRRNISRGTWSIKVQSLFRKQSLEYM